MRSQGECLCTHPPLALGRRQLPPAWLAWGSHGVTCSDDVPLACSACMAALPPHVWAWLVLLLLRLDSEHRKEIALSHQQLHRRLLEEQQAELLGRLAATPGKAASGAVSCCLQRASCGLLIRVGSDSTAHYSQR
jgi:hypothetical protein